jgi:hypothetical protein
MTAKRIALPLFAALLTAGPALAQQVGTATAVNPVSESTPPGGSTDKLTVGARVMHNERIHTSPSGSAQLLFLDKSSLSIAPNTNLMIDQFVYDPVAPSLGENAAAQIILQSTQRATLPTPPARAIRGD